MSRDYGKLTSRRSSSAVWQWLIIGVVLGFGCSAVVILSGLVFGLIGFDFTGSGVAFGPTPTALVVTATTDPTIPTETPVVVVVTATPAATATVEDSQVLVPTATTPPVESAETEEPEPTITPTTETTTTTNTGTSLNTTTAGSVAFPQLVSLASPLLPIDGGTFEMGTSVAEIASAVRECVDAGGACVPAYGEDSQPPRAVTIDPFQIEQTEVSYEQYVAFLNAMGPGSHLNGCNGQRCVTTIRDENEVSAITFDTQNYDVVVSFQLDLPAEQITWFGAQAYCEAIGRRLPTEAEWERAARGPNNFIYPWGNTWDPARANTNSQASVGVDTLQSGSSGFGVINMAGNVAEWVRDWYQDSYASLSNINPQGPASGVDRVIRGGSWPSRPFFARTVHRQHEPPAGGGGNNALLIGVGFRCAADAAAGINPIPNTGNNVVPVGTVDPATLGGDLGGDAPISAPTLPPAPGAGDLPPGSNE